MPLKPYQNQLLHFFALTAALFSAHTAYCDTVIRIIDGTATAKQPPQPSTYTLYHQESSSLIRRNDSTRHASPPSASPSPTSAARVDSTAAKDASSPAAPHETPPPEATEIEFTKRLTELAGKSGAGVSGQPSQSHLLRDTNTVPHAKTAADHNQTAAPK